MQPVIGDLKRRIIHDKFDGYYAANSGFGGVIAPLLVFVLAFVFLWLIPASFGLKACMDGAREYKDGNGLVGLVLSVISLVLSLFGLSVIGMVLLIVAYAIMEKKKMVNALLVATILTYVVGVGIVVYCVTITHHAVETRYKATIENDSFQKAGNMSGNAERDEFASYIGETISGSQVVSLIRQWSAYEVSIVVRADGADSVYNYSHKEWNRGDRIDAVTNSENLIKAEQKWISGVKNKSYIDPYAMYFCKSQPDSNGDYTVILFEKQ